MNGNVTYIDTETSVEVATVEPHLRMPHAATIAAFYGGSYADDRTGALPVFALRAMRPYASAVINVSYMPREDSWAHNKILNLKLAAHKSNFEIPNKRVVELSKEALTCIRSNNADLLFLNPIADGGALIEFKKNDSSFILEIDNDVEIALLKKGEIPVVEDLDQDSLVNSLQSSLADA